MPTGSRFAVGDRVAGPSVWGSLAEQVLAVPRHTVRLPDSMSWGAGAAYCLNHVTALFALRRVGLLDGQSVLVHGAAGGVGSATLDLMRGCAAPVAVVSSDDEAEVAWASGAEQVLLTTASWSARARELTGGPGVDVVVDPVDGDRVPDSLRALDSGGRLMVVGFADGTIPEVRANRPLLRDLSVIGVALEPWQQRFPGVAEELVQELEELAVVGRVHPHVGDLLPFDRADEALGIIERAARRAARSSSSSGSGQDVEDRRRPRSAKSTSHSKLSSTSASIWKPPTASRTVKPWNRLRRVRSAWIVSAGSTS